MATAVVMPKLGNTVESCIIIEWKKQEGDPVQEGETICDVETDKAVMEVPSPVSGTLLARFFAEGDDVPVLTNIAAIGEPGEDFAHLRPNGAAQAEGPGEAVSPAAPLPAAVPEQERTAAEVSAAQKAAQAPPLVGISPRARNLAARKGLDVSSLKGTGPGGRIIERDVMAALAARPRLSPVAQAMVEKGGYIVPERGTGPGGRIMSHDLIPVSAAPQAAEMPQPTAAEEVETIPLKGVRKVIAERMLSSLQTTAQLTLNASADARALLDYRRRLKESPETLELQRITINDLILFAVSRVLLQHLDLNALFDGSTISRYRNVHLAVAVDTPRGLVVPVIRNANHLSLKQISQEAKRLAEAAISGHVNPDELTGGTFTVTNLGSLGIESFTPILNPPQVAILGVGNINLKPLEVEGEVQFIPHIGLSLTINHQVVDGAPGARFLQALAQALAHIDLLLAM